MNRMNPYDQLHDFCDQRKERRSSVRMHECNARSNNSLTRPIGSCCTRRGTLCQHMSDRETILPFSKLCCLQSKSVTRGSDFQNSKSEMQLSVSVRHDRRETRKCKEHGQHSDICIPGCEQTTSPVPVLPFHPVTRFLPSITFHDKYNHVHVCVQQL